MPIYEYACKKCGNQFEYLVLPSSSTPECPGCKSQELDQLISTFGVKSEAVYDRHIESVKKQRAENVHERHKMEHRIASEDS